MYLTATSDGRYVLGANYGQDSVDVYPVTAGIAGEPTQNYLTGEKAHCVVIHPKAGVLVPNLGDDTISLLDFNGALRGPQFSGR